MLIKVCPRCGGEVEEHVAEFYDRGLGMKRRVGTGMFRCKDCHADVAKNLLVFKRVWSGIRYYKPKACKPQSIFDDSGTVLVEVPPPGPMN